MSSGTVDNSSSSVVSEPRKIEIISRDGDLCVLCGVDPVEVAQIIGTKSGYGKVRLVDSFKWLNFTQKLLGARLIGFARWHRRCPISVKMTLKT